MDPSERSRAIADKAREELRSAGFDDRAIERLAERYIAEHRDEDVDAFVAWARASRGATEAVDEMSEQSFPASDPPSTWASAGGAAPSNERR